MSFQSRNRDEMLDTEISMAVEVALAADRDRIYREVHDDRSRQLDAALFEVAYLTELNAAQRNDIARLNADVADLRRMIGGVAGSQLEDALFELSDLFDKHIERCRKVSDLRRQISTGME